MPEVLNVPMFTGIRIHSGNTAKDTAGCLLVGETRSVETRSIGRSRAAYKALMTKLRAALDAGETIDITYENPPKATVTVSTTFRLANGSVLWNKNDHAIEFES
jgi:hypothetical protein